MPETETEGSSGAVEAGLEFNLAQYPFARDLDPDGIKAEVLRFRELYEAGNLEISPQIITDRDTHYLDILFLYSEDDGSDSSSHFYRASMDNREKLCSRELGELRNRLMILSSNPENPEGLAKDVIDSVCNVVGVTSAKDSERAIVVVDGELVGDRIPVKAVIQPERIGIDDTAVSLVDLLTSGAELDDKELQSIRNQLVQWMVDQQQNIGAIQLIAAAHRVIVGEFGDKDMPKDPQGRIEYVVESMLMAKQGLVKVEKEDVNLARLHAEQEKWRTQDRLYGSLARASDNFLMRMIAPKEVKEALAFLVESGVVRIVSDMIPKDADITQVTDLLRQMTLTQVDRMSIRAQARKQRDIAKAEARARKGELETIEAARKNREMVKAQAAGQQALDVVEDEKQRKAIETAKKRSEMRREAWGGWVGGAVDGLQEKARGLWGELFDREEGIIVGTAGAVGELATRGLGWCQENLVRAETVTIPVGAAGGYIAGVHLATVMAEAVAINPTVPIVLITASGVALGVYTPTVIRRLGARFTQGKGQRRRVTGRKGKSSISGGRNIFGGSPEGSDGGQVTYKPYDPTRQGSTVQPKRREISLRRRSGKKK